MLCGPFMFVCVLPREVATIGYRSGPEWLSRFGSERANPEKPPDFCPDFKIETYLDRQVSNIWTKWQSVNLFVCLYDRVRSSVLAMTPTLCCTSLR